MPCGGHGRVLLRFCLLASVLQNASSHFLSRPSSASVPYRSQWLGGRSHRYLTASLPLGTIAVARPRAAHSLHAKSSKALRSTKKAAAATMASSSSSSSSSEDSAARRKRKEKKRRKKEKKRRRKEEKKARKRRRADESPEAEPPLMDAHDMREAADFKEAVLGTQQQQDSSDDEGPMPLPEGQQAQQSEADYGKALRPGEGAAIAQYVQKNMRIPRRGEVGWQGEEIERLESVGYVMSGSRHARMNAVRIRKENQVYSAEEKRALALITFEEKQQAENKTMAQFRDMLTKRLRDQDKDS